MNLEDYFKRLQHLAEQQKNNRPKNPDKRTDDFRY